MTSALGGRGFAKFLPKERRLGEYVTDKGEGGFKNPKNLEDVIYYMHPLRSSSFSQSKVSCDPETIFPF